MHVLTVMIGVSYSGRFRDCTSLAAPTGHCTYRPWTRILWRGPESQWDQERAVNSRSLGPVGASSFGPACFARKCSAALLDPRESTDLKRPATDWTTAAFFCGNSLIVSGFKFWVPGPKPSQGVFGHPLASKIL